MASTTNPKGMMAQEEKERPKVEATGMEELEIKSKTTFFKVASVSVYVAAVGGNGFMISIFYLFIWNPAIQSERPSNIPPDYGWFGGPSRYTADEMAFPQPLKDIQPLVAPYHRIMSTEYSNKVLNSYLTQNGGNSDIPDAPRALPLQAQEQYDNKGSTVKPASNSPRYTRSTNMHDYDIGSEEGFDSTSSSDGGPMAKPKMTGSAITSH